MLTHCTLTGIADDTELDAVWALATEFPHAEFGVLYSEARAGQGRYPTREWIEVLVERLRREPGPRMALHLCGESVDDFLAVATPKAAALRRIACYFPRVQLNLRATPDTATLLRKLHTFNLDQTYITQHNAANAQLWAALMDVDNHAILFDESGGRGRTPALWPEPLPGLPCGYAGGLGPDNLKAELAKIHRLAGSRAYWVDMESKLRTAADTFDLAAARRCLELSRLYHDT